jgi:hypothetical protein
MGRAGRHAEHVSRRRSRRLIDCRIPRGAPPPAQRPDGPFAAAVRGGGGDVGAEPCGGGRLDVRLGPRRSLGGQVSHGEARRLARPGLLRSPKGRLVLASSGRAVRCGSARGALQPQTRGCPFPAARRTTTVPRRASNGAVCLVDAGRTALRGRAGDTRRRPGTATVARPGLETAGQGCRRSLPPLRVRPPRHAGQVSGMRYNRK